MQLTVRASDEDEAVQLVYRLGLTVNVSAVTTSESDNGDVVVTADVALPDAS